MQEEEKKTVDIDTSGPEVDIQLPEEKKEDTVVEQSTEDKTYENERETKLEDGGIADDSPEKSVQQSDSEKVINKKITVSKLKSILRALKSE